MTVTAEAAVFKRPVSAHAEPAPPAASRHPPALARGLADSFGQALEHRRLFLLWPYAIIAGLIASLVPQTQPDPLALVLVGIALALALILSRSRLTMHRVFGLVAAFWVGFSLLAENMLPRMAFANWHTRAWSSR